MNLRDIDPEGFIPMGHNRKALLVERIGDAFSCGGIVIPDKQADPVMTSGLEPPILEHYYPRLCRVLAVGPNVRGVKAGDIINVPGAGNCYADLEDGQGIGSRLLIREGDIALVKTAGDSSNPPQAESTRNDTDIPIREHTNMVYDHIS